VAIPQLGVGTYRLKGDDVREPLLLAFREGVRMIDTAWMYGNETNIGAVLDSLSPSPPPFIVTKLWRKFHGPCKIVFSKLRESTKHLGRIPDLFLLHWPGPGRGLNRATIAPNDWDPAMRIETWRAMLDCWREGLVRAVGVCNFSIRQLEELHAST
ncbi:NADP-dependent oxidoreductase domain-containing protein, partial [Blyttiomyces helicus]